MLVLDFGKKMKKVMKINKADIWSIFIIVIYNINYFIFQFSQNEELKKILYATHPKILAEASPGDRIWGIGLRKDNPLAWDRKTWRGKNLLGYALTRVRDKLMKKDGLIDES